jgi:hypothetical protein
MAATVGTQHSDLPGPVLLSQDIQTRREGICHLVSDSRFSHQVQYVCTIPVLDSISVSDPHWSQLSADTVPDPANTLAWIRIRIRIQLYHHARGKPIIPPCTFTFLTK